MQLVLAALPIGLVVAAMALLRWRAASAGALGLVVALVLAVTLFGYGGAPDGPGVIPAVGGAMAEAGFTTVAILWIIFPALCLYELQSRSGAFAAIRSALAHLTDDARLQAVLIAWFFALFVEGVAGFGTPVALAAPMLVGLGVSPVRAVTLALVGHAAGVSFGAIGTPVVPQAAVGFPGIELAQPTALLHALLGWSLVTILYVGADKGPWRFADLRWPVVAALLFFVPYLALAWFAGPELPTVGGAVIGGTAFALIVRWRRSGGGERIELSAGAVVRAVLPYAILLVLVLATRLLPPLRALLETVVLDWRLYDVFHGRFEPLYHPGTLLFASFIAGGLLQGRSWAEHLDAMIAAARRLGVVALALAAMLGLSRILVHSGMIDMLATGAATSGAFWPLVAPFVGVLGTFVTGSATASNILFTELQQATATALNLPATLMHGAQNFGAAIGNIVSPHNIIAGAATAGLASGREGEVLRRTILVCLGYAAAGGVLAGWLARGA